MIHNWHNKMEDAQYSREFIPIRLPLSRRDTSSSSDDEDASRRRGRRRGTSRWLTNSNAGKALGYYQRPKHVSACLPVCGAAAVACHTTNNERTTDLCIAAMTMMGANVMVMLTHFTGEIETLPLFPGLGTHYVDIYVGTPPQRQSVIVDTGR